MFYPLLAASRIQTWVASCLAGDSSHQSPFAVCCNGWPLLLRFQFALWPQNLAQLHSTLVAPACEIVSGSHKAYQMG